MIQIIDIPTEQTTAATDVLLAVISFFVARKVFQTGHRIDPQKTKIWVWAFGLLAFAAAIGAVAHGLQMSKLTNLILWQPLNLSLGIAIGLFVAGVVYDFREFTLPRLLIPVMLVFAILFFTVTVLIPNAFIVFIIYEAIAMLFSFIVYTVMAARKQLKGAIWMSAGIFITIVAAAIQAIESIKIEFIWIFDHNGIFHIVQILGLFTLLKGLLIEFRSRMRQTATNK